MMTRPCDMLPPVRGTYTQGAPLKDLVWFRAGGPAEILFRPADADDLVTVRGRVVDPTGKPVAGADYLTESVERLEKTRANLDQVYGPTAEAVFTLDAVRGEGSLAGLLDFVAQPLGPLGEG